MSGHYCAAIGCQDAIAKPQVMCLFHWAMIPPELGDEILRHWQEGKGSKELAYLNPKIAAVEMIHRRERPDLYESEATLKHPAATPADA